MQGLSSLLAEEDVLVKKKTVGKPAGMHVHLYCTSCGPSDQLNTGFHSMKHLL